MLSSELLAVLGALPQGATITDGEHADNAIIWCNEAFLTLTGYSRDEVIGRNCRFLQGDQNNADLRTQIKEAIFSFRPVLVEILNFRKDGTAFWNALSIATVPEKEGKPRYFIGLQTDVTRFKQAENQLKLTRRLEEIGRITSGIAHDLNNALTVISGLAEVLERSANDRAQQELLEQMRTAIQSAMSVTTGLLSYARREPSDKITVSLNDAIVRLIGLLRYVVGPGIRVNTDLQSNVGAVTIDPDQLTHVLFNLAANARDAMQQGGVLSIETSSHDVVNIAGELQRVAVLTVADTGIGIDAKIVDRVFEPFFTTKGGEQGSGLGLAMVREFVNDARGHVRLVSEKLRGTRVILELPMVTDVTPAASSDAPKKRDHGIRILVVEDNPGIRMMLERGLPIAGFDVYSVGSAEAAMQILRARSDEFDFVLTDVMLENATGRDLVEFLREHSLDIPVTFMTGVLQAGYDLEHEGFRVLHKPLSLSKIVAEINLEIKAFHRTRQSRTRNNSL